MQTHRKRLSRPQWQDIIDQQHQSGEPARAWCAANDVGYASFMKWRKQLRDDSDDVNGRIGSPSFIELTEPLPASGAPVTSGWLVELDLPAGVQLRIARGA